MIFIIILVALALFLIVTVTTGINKKEPSGLATQNTKTPLTKHNFFLTMIRYGNGYDWSLMLPLAISALETNFGKSCYFYNLFNITTQSNDPAEYFVHATIPGLKFKKYSGYAESINHFWRLINTGRYKEVFKNRHDPAKAIVELIKAGYAGNLTDPKRYLNMMVSVQNHYNRHYT